jgi:hypothetical protein
MPYHIKNNISKKELRKQGKNVIPLDLMKPSLCCEKCHKNMRLTKYGNNILDCSELGNRNTIFIICNECAKK